MSLMIPLAADALVAALAVDALLLLLLLLYCCSTAAYRTAAAVRTAECTAEHTAGRIAERNTLQTANQKA